MGQPSYHKHHRHKDLAVRPHRDVEEPVKEEDEHGRGVVEEDVVPGPHNHQNHNGDQQKKTRTHLKSLVRWRLMTMPDLYSLSRASYRV